MLAAHYKRRQLRSSQVKEMLWQGMGKGCKACMSTWRVPLSSNLHGWTNPEDLQTLSSLVFLWRLHYLVTTDQIISHWGRNSTSSPSPLPGGLGVGPKVPVSYHLIGSIGNQPPSLDEIQNYLMDIKKAPLLLSSQEIPRVSGELCAENGVEDQIYVSYYKSYEP